MMNSRNINGICILMACMILASNIQETSCDCIGPEKPYTCHSNDWWWTPYVDTTGLPGEIHASLSFSETTRKNCPNGRKTCVRLSQKKMVGDNDYLIDTLKWELTVASNVYQVGLAWRLYTSVIESYDHLPGFHQQYTVYNTWNRFRFLITNVAALSVRTNNGNNGTIISVKAKLLTSCFKFKDLPDARWFYGKQYSDSECGVICDGRSSYMSSEGSKALPTAGELRIGHEIENPSAKIKSNQFTLTFTRLEDENAKGDYHVFLYENSIKDVPIRPIIADTKSEGKTYSDKQTVTMTIDLNKNGQYRLLLRATSRFPDENSCTKENSFLGDVYPDWGNNVSANLGVALARCSSLTDCTNWLLLPLTWSA